MRSGVALGLTAYTVEDMNSLVNLLADYIQLDFEREEGVVYEKPRRLSRLAAVSRWEDLGGSMD